MVAIIKNLLGMIILMALMYYNVIVLTEQIIAGKL